jgi:hypothetical protein
MPGKDPIYLEKIEEFLSSNLPVQTHRELSHTHEMDRLAFSALEEYKKRSDSSVNARVAETMKRLVKRDRVTFAFCTPAMQYPTTTTSDAIQFDEEFRVAGANREKRFNMKLDGFALYTEQKLKYQSTMRNK